MMTEAEYMASTNVTVDGLRDALQEIASQESVWAGAPMPVRAAELKIEPRYPYARLDGFRFDGQGVRNEVDNSGVRIINEWYSHKRSCRVYVFEDSEAPGRSRVACMPEYGGRKLGFWLASMAVAAEAYSVEAEATAQARLCELISGVQRRSYLLTGVFLETSKRSGIKYLFRRGRPTVALRSQGDELKVAATLCLHPIGFYEGTWCGVMVPSDDVIAHLMLMRGDEHRFWKKANHHPSWAAEAGF